MEFPLHKQVNNLLQIGSAELLIDNPNNKSGLKSFKQYPIINANAYSYIFYDKIPGWRAFTRRKISISKWIHTLMRILITLMLKT